MKGFYMFKKGFTLAEVLITLTIIGVVSALTLPGLLTDTSTAQIGPKLAKMSATLSQANQALLHDLNLDNFTPNGKLLYDSGQEYLNDLSSFLKFVPYSDDSYSAYVQDLSGLNKFSNEACAQTSDGTLFCVVLDENVNTNGVSDNRTKIGSVFVDVNGNSGANATAADVFPFVLTSDGSMNPAGSISWDTTGAFYYKGTWREYCAVGTVPSNTSACTGHIFENNLKVLYK